VHVVTPVAPPVRPEETADPIPPSVPRADATPKSATVYRVDSSGERARLIPAKIDVPEGEDPMQAALDALSGGGDDAPLPKGTRVRDVQFLRDKGNVIVDFNAALKENFPGGDEEEALVIGAITGTLAHFPGVERVQILVDGKKIDSLGGNQDLTQPLPVRAPGGGGGSGG
jgi:spore germination protein GerM